MWDRRAVREGPGVAQRKPGIPPHGCTLHLQVNSAPLPDSSLHPPGAVLVWAKS